MGITSMGAICVAMNAWWTEKEMRYGIEDSGLKTLFVDRERLDRLIDALEQGNAIACARLKVEVEEGERASIEIDPTIRISGQLRSAQIGVGVQSPLGSGLSIYKDGKRIPLGYRILASSIGEWM